ncbi:site-specific integrase [Halioglobus maricola]|uniref:Site-specific integrase n=1 Tax=Halioglobus maricola TaxID=2601894 RepID=A0A5P9NHP8_9GAMM|nr:site-specific integrase [Halioglobus maricola]QFU75353.1 site-specific integrase [Halioglobus maricola]
MGRTPTYYHLLQGYYHFQRRLGGSLLRTTLRTQDEYTARQRAGVLYTYSSQLHRAGLQFPEVSRLTRIRAQQLYEEGLTEFVVAPKGAIEAPTVDTSGHVRTLSDTLPPSPVPRPLLLKEALEDALRDLCRTGGKEHRRKYREAFTELSLLNPGAYFHEFRFAEAREHLEALLRLPRRRTDRKPYKSMPIDAVLELDTPPDQLLSATSINERMKRLGKLWEWATEAEAYSGPNPFRSKTLRLPEKPRERGRYTEEDLKVLFSSPLFACKEYRRGPGGRKSWWWLIILGLYTGARVGELAQLRLEDVQTVDGVMCLSINDEGDKSVKTPAGIRLVPVHPELLRLGFEEYLLHLKQRGHNHILPYPNENTEDPAQRCSKWFGGTYRANELPAGWSLKNLVYHSFRHTFINRAIKEQGIDTMVVQSLAGHTLEGMGESRRYATGRFRMETLNQSMASYQPPHIPSYLSRMGWKKLPHD